MTVAITAATPDWRVLIARYSPVERVSKCTGRPRM
jgi:hypothetical protein